MSYVIVNIGDISNDFHVDLGIFHETDVQNLPTDMLPNYGAIPVGSTGLCYDTGKFVYLNENREWKFIGGQSNENV